MFGGFFLRANARWRVLKIFGPSLAKPKIKAAKEKCAGDTQYRRAHFNAGCVDFGESDDVENIFNTIFWNGLCVKGVLGALLVVRTFGRF